MTKQQLVNNCLEKIEDINLKLEYAPAEYLFFSELLDQYDFKSVASIFTIAYTDIVSAYLGSIIKDKSFNIIAPDVNSFSVLLERFGSGELRLFSGYILSCIKDGSIDIIRSAFEDSNTIRGRRVVSLPSEDKEDMRLFDPDLLLDDIIKYNRVGEINIPNFIYYFEAYPEEMSKAMNIICEIKKMKMFFPLLTMSKEEVDAAVSNSVEIGKDANVNISINFNKETIDNGIKGDKLFKKFAIIKKHGEEIIQNRKNEVRALKKELRIYEDFLEEVKKLGENKEIKSYAVAGAKIPDKDLRMEYLKLVLEHNNEEYKKLDIRLKEYNANTSTKYLALLQKYNIKKDEINIKAVMRNTLDEVSNMLMFLNNITKNKELRIKALELGDNDTIVSIKELFNKGILNEDCLLQYPSLFVNNSDINKLLSNNIELCKNYGFDLSNLSNNPEVLLNNNNLNDNFKIIDKYNYKFDLITRIKPNTNCKFLSLNKLDEKIDKILELGYESLLDSDISLLNESNWDRIYVLKALGFIPKNKDELLDILRSDTFIMPDNMINNYIHNAVPYCETEFKLDPSFITDFYHSTRTININGVILSKNRILRDENLSFQSIIRDSILTRDEIETLLGELKQKTYKIEG